MKTIVLTFLFTFLLSGLFSQGQLSSISIGPRVGESIIISCSLEEGEKYIGSISFTAGGADVAGKFTVGPFSVTVNSKTYHTDSMTFDIDVALPETTDGIWVRVIHQNGKTYISIDQNSSTLKTKTDFTDLNTETFADVNVEIHEIENSFMSYKGAKRNLVYQLKWKDGFKKFKLTNTYFNLLPANTYLGDIWVE